MINLEIQKNETTTLNFKRKIVTNFSSIQICSLCRKQVLKMLFVILLLTQRKKYLGLLEQQTFLAQIRFTLWTSKVISQRMFYCSGVAMLMLAGADHINASSFHSSHFLTTIYNERKSCIMLIITIRNNKASWTSQSNAQKLKGVLFLDYGSCFLLLVSHPSRHYFS